MHNYILILIDIGVIYLLGLDQEEDEVPFDNGGRYDSTILDDMAVIYSNQADIAHWNNGYSESDSCPWGVEHNGLDYMFYKNSIVIAASPGFVEDIEVGFLPDGDVYFVGMSIRFNESVTIGYGFEGFSNDKTVREEQEAMIDVEIGDLVAKGDQIGRFFRPTEFDHIHFSVYHDDQAFYASLIMGVNYYNEIMSLIQTFHSDWELCYP